MHLSCKVALIFAHNIRNMQMYKYCILDMHNIYARDAYGVDRNLPARFHTRDSALGTRENISWDVKKSCYLVEQIDRKANRPITVGYSQTR